MVPASGVPPGDSPAPPTIKTTALGDVLLSGVVEFRGPSDSSGPELDKAYLLLGGDHEGGQPLPHSPAVRELIE